jgi:hypothetical protein
MKRAAKSMSFFTNSIVMKKASLFVFTIAMRFGFSIPLTAGGHINPTHEDCSNNYGMECVDMPRDNTKPRP